MCFNCFKSGHSKKNCKTNIKCYHCKGTQPFVIKGKIRNSYNRGVRRNSTQLPQRDHKGIKTKHQNQIQHEDGESQESLPESNIGDKLSCLVEGNTPMILKTTNAIATDNYENKISKVKILLNLRS